MNPHYIREDDEPAAADEADEIERAEERAAALRILACLLLAFWLCVGMVVWNVSHAAMVFVNWKNPTTNTDGSPLTDLAYIRVEWGSCVGAAFGTLQSSIKVNAPAESTPVYPSALSRVCIRAFAVNSAARESISSNVAAKDLLPTLDKPVTLGQPIILSFAPE